jgi:hypothetical protein
MNYHEWTWPDFYADGRIIIAGDSLEECLKRLKEKEFELWRNLQTSFYSSAFKEPYEEYVLSQLNSEILKTAINSYRDEIVSDDRNGIICIEWHKNASNYEMLRRDMWKFNSILIDEYIENNLVDGKTPWFFEPKVYDMDKIFYYPSVA